MRIIFRLLLGVSAFVFSSAFADNLNFPSPAACDSYMTTLADQAYNSTEKNQNDYSFYFLNLKSTSVPYTEKNSCNGNNCTFTARMGGCRLVKFQSYQPRLVQDPQNILWGKAILGNSGVQQEITNFNVNHLFDNAKGIFEISCPNQLGYAADVNDCTVTQES